MSRRTERLAKFIKQEISESLEREVNDPRLSNFISVTRVLVSPDLKYAKVFVSRVGDEVDKEEMLAGFDAACGFLRKKLASHLRVRCVPQLSFHYDDSIEQGAKVLKLIEQVRDTK